MHKLDLSFNNNPREALTIVFISSFLFRCCGLILSIESGFVDRNISNIADPGTIQNIAELSSPRKLEIYILVFFN